MAEPRLLCLHGFRSSPASWKIRVLREHLAGRGLADRVLAPQLSHEPAVVIAELSRMIETSPGPLTLLGASLGGYYATWLAERYDLKAVLVNPAVVAHLSLARYLGRQQWLHNDQSFDFTPTHIEQLQALQVATLTPSRYLLLAETGDEVLDYRQAVARYAGCRQMVFEGGEHGFSRFPQCLPQVLDFAGFPPPDAGL
ncbi:MAG: hypothetical protein RIR00_2569 [Pseudomonadota bacterium]|jgi:predicted esterase YcpF (UPF0227 family)